MPILISLLRGVNVGGYNKIKMDTLRSLYESLGLQHPQTYVQSGNVVFRTDSSDSVVLASRIEHEIERSFGFRPAVIIRTLPQLSEVVVRNPFATRSDIAPDKLLVTFLAIELGQDAQHKLAHLKVHPEEIRVRPSELYIYYPDGMGRSKLPVRSIEKILGSPGTSRNWNSVLKLLSMAEALEAAQ